MKKLIFFYLFITITSCKPILLFIAEKSGELIDPQKESPATVEEYCCQMKVNYDGLFVIKTNKQYSSFINKYRQIPEVFVFDGQKNQLTTEFSSICPWTTMNLLFDSTIHFKRVENTKLYSEILSNFTPVKNAEHTKPADYYILCTWAKYTPKLTKSLFETINKQKQENKLNVCHILLNVDLQESWDKN